MEITKDTIERLCWGWAIVVLLGIVVGVNVAFILMCIWTLCVLLKK